ncbi:type I-C CRISPR-associated protein Cas5c [Stackebrandtia nassauensis]|uniref:pre-crRNA processing endonuclease n=1 Tax=Stackebrandtia nassauensis (strain DSM 44728 / CIP 108903 / NRRL B-16338 / NBRC 102104 / LLR-40K-21) TaxID=446470 RepID=D3PWM0_STANL|nr:type I-C CRISPR-associated protein Cas5c [Stackebrandtia nassauensis]ADD43242.1 CRISPR-associated protein Cas5 family [Stackebrandtia nassauensis DSM 44728]
MTPHGTAITLPTDPHGHRPVAVQVWGDAALFTRPELKAERLTYPVMTPSAAKGVLEAIYWKPEMAYQVVAIEVLKPIKQFTVRRNETNDVASLRDAAKGVRRIDTAAKRDQRNAVCLRDVAYRIHAHIRLQPHANKPVVAYRDQFRRRVDKGACFAQPYLGTREFTAYFGKPDGTPARDELDGDLGIMIHTVGYDGDHAMEWFTARLDRGVLRVPERGIVAEASHISAAVG